ncbi:MAG: VWA domain-containing protein [Saprospiraceae bacterium]|jgi:Mg-chelatase subunit ChlD
MNELERWRLILGKQADPTDAIPLEGDAAGMDGVLEALYDGDRKGGLGSSSPKVNRWLGDIRKYFPRSVVQVLQRDALERLQLHELLLEPELLSSVEPDVHLAATLLSLNKIMPDRSRETARELIRKIVSELEEKLRAPLIDALQSKLNRNVRNFRPKRVSDINWNQTIRRNLRHYQSDLKTIIPEQLVGYGRKGRAIKHLILLIDQSGSMAESVVYAGIYSSVLASLRSVQTRVIAFDTAVVDLSEHLNDPVELLFGIQLGGGTDIHKAMQYAQSIITAPQDTTLVLISDLYEGGSRKALLKTVHEVQQSGVNILALLALSDAGAPSYDHEIAAALAALQIKAMACTPDQFPDLLADSF